MPEISWEGSEEPVEAGKLVFIYDVAFVYLADDSWLVGGRAVKVPLSVMRITYEQQFV